MNPQKAKGKRYEYEIRDYFKSIGYEDCIVSSSESINADNMGIDLLNLPFIIQCKSGYKTGLNKNKVITTIQTKIKKSKYKDQLVFLFHKSSRKTEVSFDIETYHKIKTEKSFSSIEYLCLKDGIVTVDFTTFKEYLQNGRDKRLF